MEASKLNLKPVVGLNTTSADFKHFRISFVKVANTRKSENDV